MEERSDFLTSEAVTFLRKNFFLISRIFHLNKSKLSSVKLVVLPFQTASYLGLKEESFALKKPG